MYTDELVWDDENERHITRRHGITREQVAEALGGVTLQRGTEMRNRELRIRLLGRTREGLVLFCVITRPRPGVVRVVTAFPANRKLRTLFEEYTGARK
jgi:uncharacterized DUF497 family protein